MKSQRNVHLQLKLHNVLHWPKTQGNRHIHRLHIPPVCYIATRRDMSGGTGLYATDLNLPRKISVLIVLRKIYFTLGLPRSFLKFAFENRRNRCYQWLSKSTFNQYHATLCVSAVFAVARCAAVSVRLSVRRAGQITGSKVIQSQITGENVI